MSDTYESNDELIDLLDSIKQTPHSVIMEYSLNDNNNTYN